MPELGSYGSVGAGEGNLSLYPESSKIKNQQSAILYSIAKIPSCLGSSLTLAWKV